MTRNMVGNMIGNIARVLAAAFCTALFCFSAAAGEGTDAGRAEKSGLLPMKPIDPQVLLNRRLWQACREGADVAELKALVEAGASIDSSGGPGSEHEPPANDLLLEMLRGTRDNPEAVAYLLELGMSPEGGIKPPPLLLASRGSTPKPESARVLARAGADPLALCYDRYGREFGEKAGLLDGYDAPLLYVPKPAPSIAARREVEKKRVLAAAFLRPADALYSDSFYRFAAPADVQRALTAAPGSTGTRTFREREDAGRWGVLPPPPSLSGTSSRPVGLPRMEDRLLTPLSVAAGNTAEPEVINILLGAGCKVDEPKGAALVNALKNTHPGVLRSLLRHKPDMRVLKDGAWTAYAMPAHVPLLAGAGLDILEGGPDGGYLMEAARRGNYALARALADAGADLDREDGRGERLLTYAVGDGRYRFALDMIRAGANALYRDKDGRNLMRLATELPFGARRDQAEGILDEAGQDQDYQEFLEVLREAQRRGR